MKISTEKPACWDRLEKQFNVRWESGIIVTYDGVIHTQSGVLAPDFLAHELVHVKQQEGKNPEEFLERFLTDRDFRLEMELPAYRVQVAFLRATIVHDPDELFVRIHKLAKNMAANYDNMVTLEQAIILLQ